MRTQESGPHSIPWEIYLNVSMAHRLGCPRKNYPVCPRACWIHILHLPMSESQSLFILVSVLKVLERKGVPSQMLCLMLQLLLGFGAASVSNP